MKDKKTLAKVIENIHASGKSVPTTSKIRNRIATEKKALYGGSTVTLDDFLKFAKAKTAVPEDEHEAFVLHYSGTAVGEKTTVRIFITSKHLLQNATILDDHISIDGTYKLVFQRYPLVVVGSTDNNKRFHFFGVAVLSNETQDDYAFVFTTIKDGVKRLFDVLYSPNTFMSDASNAIQNAFQQVFGEDKTTLTCYSHVQRAVILWLEKQYGKNERTNYVKHDLNILYESPSKEYFDPAYNLFKSKWFKEDKEFEKYFESIWMNQHPN